MFKVSVFAADSASKRGFKKISPANFKADGTASEVLGTVKDALAKLPKDKAGSIVRVVIESDAAAPAKDFTLNFGKDK